jgi:hypothetical protein
LIIERLGGEWYEYDWYDEDEWDDEDEYLAEWSLKVIDMDEAITLLDPDVSQFETMLSKMARVAAPVKIEWMEDELFPRLNPWEDWGFEEWDDSPRKPQVHLTLTSAEKYPYGTIVRRQTGTEGNTLRFIGGQTWERVA